jgi:glycosyltransferase involved in cell wall biosynthesis
MIGAEQRSPAISVVTATYNRSRWLACAIESALKQTFQDWELIVVGDACTDDTAEVVASFGDARIRFINLERNFGEQAGPNNFGMSQATAPLVAFLNHDDVWLPNHLSLCRETLLGQAADLVFGASAHLAAGSTIPMRFDGLGIAISGAGSGYGWSPAGVEDSVAPASTWLMRREVPEKLQGWRLGRECYSDPSQDFLFRAWRQGFRIRPVREVTVVMITSARRPGSYLAAGAPEQEWVLRQLDDPAFSCELAAQAYECNDWFNRRARSRTVAAKRLAGLTVAALGISPRSLHFRLKKGFAAGDYIHNLRTERGLPSLNGPAGEVPSIRYDMVRRACRINPPADVEFRAGAGGARFLASGWSRPEGSGVWNDGPQASLLFNLGGQPAGDLIVDLEVAGFVPPSVPHLDAEVWLGESLLQTWTLGSGARLRSVRIPPAALRNGVALLSFKFPVTSSPQAAGMSDDPRELAMRLIRGKLQIADSTSD